MEKHQYFSLELFLQHEGEGITKEQESDMHLEVLEVIEKYGFLAGGSLKPKMEDGSDL